MPLPLVALSSSELSFPLGRKEGKLYLERSRLLKINKKAGRKPSNDKRAFLLVPLRRQGHPMLQWHPGPAVGGTQQHNSSTPNLPSSSNDKGGLH